MAELAIFGARIAELAFEVDVFFHGQVCGRFGLDTSADGRLGFHVVVSGNCWAHAQALPAARRLRPGDVMLFGRSVPHVVSDAREFAGRRDPEAMVALGARTALPAAGLICGYFDARNPVTAAWLEAFPDCCIVPGSECPSRWSLELARLMAHEAAADRDAASRLTSRVADLFLTMCVREHCEREGDAGALMRARRDPRLRAVLDAIEDNLALPWTVADLARLAGVSRAKFAAWFAQEVGLTPIAYLRRERILAADRMARCGDVPLRQLAATAGYRSLSSFRRRFAEVTGRDVSDCVA